MYENDNIMPLQPRQTPILSVPSSPVVCWWMCEKSLFDEDADLVMDSYCRCSKWPSLAATSL